LKERFINYDYWTVPYQEDFHFSRASKVYLSTGYGGGKTYSLIQKMFWLMNENYGLPGGLLVPTLKMYKRDVVPTIEQICDENKIRARHMKGESAWLFPDAKCKLYVFHSQDDGASIKGPNLAWGIINEVTLCSEKAFMSFLARVRLAQAKLLQIAMSGTPEGFNWTYEYFVQNQRKDTHLIIGDARRNKFVADTYFGILAESYDELMQQQYILGQWVNLTGKRAAWMFDRMKHTDIQQHQKAERIGDLPVLISLDFNVTPMAATLWNHTPGKWDWVHGKPTNQELLAFDEIKIDSSNTYEMCDAIHQRLGPIGEDMVTIFPDPAGAARSTKALQSDIQILKDYGGFKQIKYKSKISVRDCLNSLNNMLSRNLVMLNSQTCRNTIADLEQCVFKGNVFEIDKSNQSRTHWLDGTKNMIEYLYPAVKYGEFREERIR
jgi:hypothetical protein